MWAFAVLWSFPFSFLSFFNFNFFKPIIIFSTFIPLLVFPTILFPFQLIFNVYKSFYLTLFNFEYLFFLSFLPFLSPQHISQFCFHCFIPHLAPCFSFVFQFVLQLVLFLTGRYNFLFPLFTGSIYCALFLLNCFDFAYGYICIWVYSIIFIICLIL